MMYVCIMNNESISILSKLFNAPYSELLWGQLDKGLNRELDRVLTMELFDELWRELRIELNIELNNWKYK